MKPINWVRWILACCVCTSVWSTVLARYKYRYPQPPMYKKSWPIGPRISMGNSIHINVGPPGYKQNRPPNNHKPIITNNYNRYPAQNPVRRPPMFAVLPSWKAQPLLGGPGNQVNMGQRGSPKEYHSMSKLPEYSPEYRPEQALPSPPNRGEVDDDKGPIHTIPAPNLSPADKPYNLQSQSYSPSIEYTPNMVSQSAVTNYLFGTLGTSLPPSQRITPGPTSPTPTRYYEVTETNEVAPQDYRTLQPTFIIDPDFDRSQSFSTTGAQTNEIFASHAPVSNAGLIGTNIQFGASDSPMQTNLQSSLHVGFPASAASQQQTSVVEQQTPELHVGHPAPAGPPLSANQLYDLLNSFPQQLNDQYNAGSQQQQVIQQQLDQIFQSNNGAATKFSQPQMHSFNYDEQSNKQQQQQQQQQQQIFIGQDYASSRVTADYSLEPEVRNAVRNANNQAPGDNSENNIEHNDGQSTFFKQIGGEDVSGLSSQFYTTLPSRDAAEKLAALAAAGNVNSHLMGQLRKQQADFNQDSSSIPPNHKDENYNGEREESKDDLRYQQQTRYVGEEDREDEQRAQYHKETDDKRPLRIMVPDLDEYSDDFEQRNSRSDLERSKESANEDYEYEDGDDNEMLEGNESEQRENIHGNGEKRVYHDQNSNSEFGSRLTSDNN